MNKRASFDEFCNYILPYRSSDEPIETDSRQKLYTQYNWVYKYLDAGGTMHNVVDSITAQFKFRNCIKLSIYYKQPLSITQMEKSKYGLCDDGINYFVNVFRAIGFVAAKDAVPHWGNHYAKGSSLIYIKYGDEEYSTGISGNEDFKKTWQNESIPKILRRQYVNENNINILSHTKDVTSSYTPTINLSIDNIFNTTISEPVICVFDKKEVWVPVHVGVVGTDKKIIFNDIGVNVLYMVASPQNNSLKPINYPFYIDNTKKIHFFKPNEDQEETVTITRKYGLSTPRHKLKINWLKSLETGFFEASNTPNFNNPTRLHTIESLNSTHAKYINIDNPSKFKYIRFNSNGKETYLSKLAFFDKNNDSLQGEVIRKNTYYNREVERAFDNRPLSFTAGKDFTLGLKLNKPTAIGTIKFQARQDDNHINIGEDYELMYWNKKWQSLGKQKAKDTVLQYKVPSNALLWLKNLNQGREEHVFIVGEHNKQQWLGFDNY